MARTTTPTDPGAMFAYLAEPIDRNKSGIDSSLAHHLKQMGVPFYRPSTAWTWGTESMHSVIQEVNLVALRRAKVMVCHYPEGVESIGMPMELAYANENGIPVVCVSDRDRHRSGALMWYPFDVFSSSAAEVARRAAEIVGSYPMRVGNQMALPIEAATRPGLEARYVGTGQAPRVHKHGDAGYDLYCAEGVVCQPGERASVACEISIQLPDGYWCLIQGRSSSWKQGISVKASVIDAGYRGKLWVDFHNISTEPVTVEPGARIAQLIPFPLPPDLSWYEVEALDPSERGDSGYGSTGA